MTVNKDLNVGAHLYPKEDGTQNLGSSSKKWVIDVSQLSGTIDSSKLGITPAAIGAAAVYVEGDVSNINDILQGKTETITADDGTTTTEEVPGLIESFDDLASKVSDTETTIATMQEGIEQDKQAIAKSIADTNTELSAVKTTADTTSDRVDTLYSQLNVDLLNKIPDCVDIITDASGTYLKLDGGIDSEFAAKFMGEKVSFGYQGSEVVSVDSEKLSAANADVENLFTLGGKWQWSNENDYLTLRWIG